MCMQSTFICCHLSFDVQNQIHTQVFLAYGPAHLLRSIINISQFFFNFQNLKIFFGLFVNQNRVDSFDFFMMIQIDDQDLQVQIVYYGITAVTEKIQLLIKSGEKIQVSTYLNRRTRFEIFPRCIFPLQTGRTLTIFRRILQST